MPLPNDQFSFATSTRLITASSRRTFSWSCRPSAMRLKRAFFMSTVRPVFIVIWIRMMSPRVGVAEIAVGNVELLDCMFGDDLEFVVGGHIDYFAQCVVDDFADLLAVGGGLAFDEVDADERHVLLPAQDGLRRRAGDVCVTIKRHRRRYQR